MGFGLGTAFLAVIIIVLRSIRITQEWRRAAAINIVNYTQAIERVVQTSLREMIGNPFFSLPLWGGPGWGVSTGQKSQPGQPRKGVLF